MVPGRQVRQAVQLVDASGVRRAGDADDPARFQALRAIRGHGRFQGREVHPVQVVHGDLPQLAAPQPKQVDGLVEAVVGLARDVEGQAGHLGTGILVVVHLREVAAQLAVDGQLQPGDVGQGAPRHQGAEAVGRQAEQVAQPADDRLLDGRAAGCVPPGCGVLVHGGGQHLAEHRHRQGRGIHHAEVASATDAHGVGEHPRATVLDQFGERHPLFRQRLAEQLVHAHRGHRPVHAAALQPLEVLHRQVHHPVTHLPQLRLVEGELPLGLDGFLAARGLPAQGPFLVASALHVVTFRSGRRRGRRSVPGPRWRNRPGAARRPRRPPPARPGPRRRGPPPARRPWPR